MEAGLSIDAEELPSSGSCWQLYLICPISHSVLKANFPRGVKVLAPKQTFLLAWV
jgi:hypothetical protein